MVMHQHLNKAIEPFKDLLFEYVAEHGLPAELDAHQRKVVGQLNRSGISREVPLFWKGVLLPS